MAVTQQQARFEAGLCLHTGERATPGACVCAVCARKPFAPTPDALHPVTPMTEQVRPGETGPAKKMDMGKPPITAGFFKYFARASIAVSYISEYGDRKYAQPGKPQYSPAWQEVPNGEQRYGDADGRHRVKAVVEGDYDSESDMAHLAHKAWNAMAELEIALKSGRVELRMGNQIVDGVPMPGTFKRVSL